MIRADFAHGDLEDVHQVGLGEFLERFLRENNMLGDAFDNLTHVLTLDRPHDELRLVARGSVEVAEVDDGEPAGRINPKVFLRSTRLTAADDAIRAFAEPMRATVRARPLIGVTDLVSAVIDRIAHAKGVTSAETTAAQAFELGAGVHQDRTQVFLACPVRGVRLGGGEEVLSSAASVDQ